MRWHCLSIAIALSAGLSGCAWDREIFGNTRIVAPAEPIISSATFCEVMAAQGGAFIWSSKDTQRAKERADKLNSVWVMCPQYQPPKPQ